MTYRKVSIMGMGLIGGSIGMDLISKELAYEVWGCGRNSKRLEIAVHKKACTHMTTDIKEAVTGSDIVIVATPPDIIIRQLPEIAEHAADDALVMDVGSVKAAIVNSAEEAGFNVSGAEFVGCHPMAGSEKAGIEYAEEALFAESRCIVTPSSSNSAKMTGKAADFWKNMGAEVSVMDADEHDFLIGFVSHLPHVVSSALIKTAVDKVKDTESIRSVCGPSFIELTRVASSPVDMWMQIYMENRRNVILAIESYIKELGDFRGMLMKKDSAKIRRFLEKSAGYRNEIC